MATLDADDPLTTLRTIERELASKSTALMDPTTLDHLSKAVGGALALVLDGPAAAQAHRAGTAGWLDGSAPIRADDLLLAVSTVRRAVEAMTDPGLPS